MLGRQGFYAEVGVQRSRRAEGHKGQNEQKGQKGIRGGRFQVIRGAGFRL